MDKRCKSRISLKGNDTCGKAGAFATKANPRIWMCKEHFERHIRINNLKVGTTVIGI